MTASALGGCVLGALLVLLPASTPQQEDDPPARRSGSLPAAEYVPRALHGFDVRLAPALVDGGDHEDVGARVTAALRHDLGDLLDQMPPASHAFLRGVPIYVGVADPVAPCACYHISPRWLRRNGFDPAKAKAVEIANARTFLEWRRGQPSMVMHELAHAYHDQVLGLRHAGLIDALARVRDLGIYRSTLRGGGRVDRHYALTNVDEYFAETTEALFGVNDFYPFVRAELLHVDRQGAALVAELWGAPLERSGRTTMSDTEGLTRAEVARLHAAFVAWFQGSSEDSEAGFASIADSLALDFHIIAPTGARLDRDATLARLRAAHGARDVAIRTTLIEAVRVDGEHVLCVYEEEQTEGREVSTLVSTALLAFSPDGPDGFVWQRVHETRRE